MKSFSQLASWPCSTVAAAAIAPNGTIHRHGDTGQVFELASITKLLTAATVHVAIEEGSVGLDDELDDRGATLADVLAHAGGFAPNGTVLEDPGMRRIYSNGGYELIAEHVANATEMAFADYMHEGIFSALGMNSAQLTRSAAFGAQASVEDLLLFVTGLPSLLAPSTLATMTTPHLPELIGVLPGYGRQAPNTWGLGPEIRATKDPHWTSPDNDPATWGHFGQTGTFLWVDPSVQVTLITLTDKPFGDWAIPRWPTFSGDVRNELRN